MPCECELAYPTNALSLSHVNELKANRRAWHHACRQEVDYLKVAKDFLDFAETIPELIDAEVRVSMVAEWIKAGDADVWGLYSETMDIDRVCELLARFVVGREPAGTHE